MRTSHTPEAPLWAAWELRFKYPFSSLVLLQSYPPEVKTVTNWEAKILYCM